MEKFVINGKKKLNGEVTISGAKNAAVAIMPAALLANGVCKIDNLPNIEDIRCFYDAMTKMGVKCEILDKHSMSIDSTNIKSFTADYDSIKAIRASYYLLGVLLGRFKKAEVALPGGCDFGSRPIDQHIKGFEALGATVTIERGMIIATADELIGSTIYLDVVSVGATINIMLAAVYAKGVTIIENAAKEPHVVDTANFLNKLGAKIKGAGTDTIKITGVEELFACDYSVIPDQIEAGTYMIAAAITNGDVTVKNIIPKHMDSLTAKLKEMNCEIEEYDDAIRVIGTDNLVTTNIKTLAYPGFPTDLQPQMTSLLCVAKGRGVITETVWDSRFQYVTELKRLGANIQTDGRLALIDGVDGLYGSTVSASDLRAGAALIIAGLCAEGTTTIKNVKYIDRGYECVEHKLANLGADITRVKCES